MEILLSIAQLPRTTFYYHLKQMGQADKYGTVKVEISAYPQARITYVDECGIDTYSYREYGYAARDQKVFSRISGRKYKRSGIVAAQIKGRVLTPPCSIMA